MKYSELVRAANKSNWKRLILKMVFLIGIFVAGSGTFVSCGKMDLGFRPDSYDCGSGMNGVGMCGDSYFDDWLPLYAVLGLMLGTATVGCLIGVITNPVSFTSHGRIIDHLGCEISRAITQKKKLLHSAEDQLLDKVRELTVRLRELDLEMERTKVLPQSAARDSIVSGVNEQYAACQNELASAQSEVKEILAALETLITSHKRLAQKLGSVTIKITYVTTSIQATSMIAEVENEVQSLLDEAAAI